MRYEFKFFYLLFILVPSLTGCLTWQGGQKTDLLHVDYPQPTHKVAVSFSNFSVERNTDTGADKLGDFDPLVQGYFLTKTKFFSTVQALPGKEDLVLQFKSVQYSHERSFWKTLGDYSYFTLSLLSLGVIPYLGFEPRRLELQVWLQGKKLKSYAASNHMKKFTMWPCRMGVLKMHQAKYRRLGIR